MEYFIHIDDPGYAQADSDFPFGRRLGPFASKKEAVNQAVADIAAGAGAGILGVFPAAASEKTRDGGDADAAVGRDELDLLADAERARRDQERVISDPSVADQWAAVEAAAAGNDELLAIMRELKGRSM